VEQWKLVEKASPLVLLASVLETSEPMKQDPVAAPVVDLPPQNTSDRPAKQVNTHTSTSGPKYNSTDAAKDPEMALMAIMSGTTAASPSSPKVATKNAAAKPEKAKTTAQGETKKQKHKGRRVSLVAVKHGVKKESKKLVKHGKKARHQKGKAQHSRTKVSKSKQSENAHVAVGAVLNKKTNDVQFASFLDKVSKFAAHSSAAAATDNSASNSGASSLASDLSSLMGMTPTESAAAPTFLQVRSRSRTERCHGGSAAARATGTLLLAQEAVKLLEVERNMAAGLEAELRDSQFSAGLVRQELTSAASVSDSSGIDAALQESAQAQVAKERELAKARRVLTTTTEMATASLQQASSVPGCADVAKKVMLAISQRL